MGELAGEVNALADLLQKQRVRSLEATALLARILEVMHAPLFAFDRESCCNWSTTQEHSCCNGPTRDASDTLLANWVSTPCSLRLTSPFTPSGQSRRAGCCARPSSARMECLIPCCFSPT